MTTQGKPFQAGQSGNPAGKAKGTRHRATLAMKALLEGEGEALTRKAIELALSGDGPALRLCLDRLMPVRRDRAISFTVPEITTTTDLPKATNALLQAVASGELTPSGAPTHVIADYSIEDEEADDALANWRVRVAHGSASALDGVLYLTEGLEMSESDWIAQHVTEH